MQQHLKEFVVRLITWQAQAILKKYSPKIVAVSGSVGKTSTKDAVYTALSGEYFVRKSEKSQNSDIGVALTILGVPNGWYSPTQWLKNIVVGFLLLIKKEEYPEWLVLEVGADHPGDIENIARWVKPDIVVLTRFPDTPVHIEFFESPEALYAEDFKIADALKEGGVLVYNQDDEHTRAYALAREEKKKEKSESERKEESKSQSISFGFSEEADVRGSGVEYRYSEKVVRGTAFRVRTSTHPATPITLLGTLGTAHAYPILSAFAVAQVLSIPFEHIVEAFSEYTPPRGRMRLLPGVKKTLLIDDSYNSSPEALSSALSAFRDIRTEGRKIAVLADMLELGEYSVEAHRKAGSEVKEAGIDLLFTVGVRARMVGTSSYEAGMDKERISMFDDAYGAGNAVESILEAGDIILIKGSESMRMERVVEELMLEPLKKADLLVRQDEAWLSKK